MLPGSFGQTIDLAVRDDAGQEPAVPDHPTIRKLRQLGADGPAPRTVGEAAEQLRREEFRRMPPTTQQKRLIELIGLYGGLHLTGGAPDVDNRWDAGCWIKAHIHLAGDWPYFDG